MRATLAGFRPAEQRDIIVNANSTARVDLGLAIGSLEEGVTVTAEAALLDTTSALRQTVLTQDTLEALPNRLDVWSITRAIPSIVTNRVDVGGSESFLQSTVTMHGAVREGAYMIDGLDVSGIADTVDTNATLYLDPFAFAESQFIAGNAPAEWARGGLLINMITKTGTNELHGGMTFSGANRGMGLANYSPALKSQLLAGVSPAILAIKPDLEPGADIHYLYDTGAWLAGPIVRDKLWFSTSYHGQQLLQYALGSYNPDGSQVPDDHYMWTTNNKIAWQMGRSTQLSYFFTVQRKVNGHRLGGTFATAAASNNNNKTPTVNQVKWTSTLASKMVFDVAGSVFRAVDRFSRQEEVQDGDIASFDSVTNTATIALPTYRDNPLLRVAMQSGVGYFTAAHDLKFGYQIVYSKIDTQVYSTSGMRAVYRAGVPDLVNTYNTPMAYALQDREQAFYVQDKWRPIRKLTINAGLRIDRNYGWMGAYCQQETQFVAAQCFSEQRGFPDWWVANPRFSAIYDLRGDGKTAVKFVANRYIHPVGTSVVSRVNPVKQVNDTRRWTACTPGQTTACDLNRDLIPQLNELGPSSGFDFGNRNRYAEGYAWPHSNEYTAEIQRQLPAAMVVTVGVTRRERRGELGSRNVAVPPESYTMLTVREANSGETVTVYNQSPALRGQIDTLWNNEEALDATYHGADLTLSKRLSDGWMMTGGLSVGKNTGYIGNSDLNNPNSQEFSRGIEGNDVPFSLRLTGLYELPYGVSLSATFQHQTGFPELTTVSVGNNTVALTQGAQVVTVAPRGDTRLPHLNQLDVSLRKAIRVGGKVFQPRLDLYNLANNATITSWVTQLGPTYHRAGAIQRGLLIKAGMSVDF